MLPVTMAHIINLIVTVCFYPILKPALVPPLQTMSEDEVKGYWLGLNDTDDELGSDSSCSR